MLPQVSPVEWSIILGSAVLLGFGTSFAIRLWRMTGLGRWARSFISHIGGSVNQTDGDER